jgi:hypothetical protein
VHAISELADMARMQLGKVAPTSQPGPQQGWAAEPQAGPLPGYLGQPQAGPPPGSWSRRSTGFDDRPISDGIEQAVADVALGAAARFIGRAVSRRVQRTVNERVMPTLASRQETLLREQIAIAERYPAIRACMTDMVIFLAGQSRVLPMPNLGTLTLQQADALVAQLQAS